MKITRISIHQVDLPLKEGSYSWASQSVEAFDTTVVIVTHELPSIFAIADKCVFLDTESKSMLATGNPKRMRDTSDIPIIREFLSRGGQ